MKQRLDEQQPKSHKDKQSVSGIAIGLAIGVAIGAATNKMGAGMLIGVALGAGLDMMRKRMWGGS
jgi:hypothetical protein